MSSQDGICDGDRFPDVSMLRRQGIDDSGLLRPTLGCLASLNPAEDCLANLNMLELDTTQLVVVKAT